MGFLFRNALPLLASAVLPLLIQAQTYNVTDLGTLGGTISIATSINASGEITGGSTNASGAYHAFLYSAGKMTDLGTLGGPSSQGQSINKSGVVAGYAQLPPSGLGGYPPHPLSFYSAFIDSETMKAIGPVGGAAYAVNDLDEVVGVAGSAFLYGNGSLTNLGSLGGTSGQTQPEAINNAGQVVGYSYLPDGNFRGFLWADGVMTALGTLGGDWSQAYAINNSGVITGTAYTTGNVADHAFTCTSPSAALKDLGTLGGTISVGTSINSSGVVVGYANTSDPNAIVYHAFIFSGSTMKDLNKLIPANSGWTLSQANSINDSGEIVGYGIIDGNEHGFLLTPVK